MDNQQVRVIQGGVVADHRGQIRFVNEFDMTQVRRFYIIKNTDTNIIRGWRGHRVEKRWFYVLSGTFSVDIIKIDDWENASRRLPLNNFVLRQSDQNLLYIPEGHATALKALEENSEMLIYADHGIENVKNDDYTWSMDYFVSGMMSM